MGITQIKGHRIANKQIHNRHLSDDFQLDESRVNLKYPTHDNSGDLSLEQKTTLTQMGNADGLHFHTGGGGGPQGIFTNEQRDVQLLKLAMLINSTKYGIDKSVKDDLNNDEDVDYGISPSIAPALSNLTDADAGVLNPNETYSYSIAYKTKYGITNVTSKSSITTENGTRNSIQLDLHNVPPDNKGIKIYRCKGNVDKQIVSDSLVEWDNPYNLDIDIEGTDKTSGYNSIKVGLKGFNENGIITHPYKNIAAGVGKRIIQSSVPLNQIATKSVPFNYYIGINNKGICNRIDVIWDKSPSRIPSQYELYYTRDTIINNVDSVNWVKFEKLIKPRSRQGIDLTISTDGYISDNYLITNNSKPQNVFLFKSISGITAIKIIVKAISQSCSLNDIRLWTVNNSDLAALNRDFGSPQSFSNYNTLKLDIKSNLKHENIKCQLNKGTETVTGNVIDYNNVSNTNYGATGKTLRMRVADNTSRNRVNYDRARVAIRVTPGQYVKFENCFFHVDDRGHAHNIAYCDVNVPEVCSAITFDGKNYYEGTPDASTNLIWSDWFPVRLPNKNITSYYVTTTVVSGSLQYRSYEYSYAWATASDAQGMEADPWLDTIPSSNIDQLVNYSFVEQVQLGISNSQTILLDKFSDTALDKWHRHYLRVPDGANADDIRKLQIFFENLLVDQDFNIDNVVLSKSKEILNQVENISLTSSNGCYNVDNIKDSTSALFFQSDLAPTNINPKSIMIESPTPIDINKVLLYFGFKDNAAKSYGIQYSNSNDANVNDPYDSPNWQNVNGLSIGEPGIPSDNIPTIVGSMVYDNEIWDTHVTNNFEKVSALKLRVVFFSTINGDALKISNVKIFTDEGENDLKKIYEANSNIPEGYVFIDDGKIETEEAPSEFNTTGSYNVYYDNNLKLIKLIDSSKTGTIYFNKLTLSTFINLLFTSQFVGDVKAYVSNNDGEDFQLIEFDKLFAFSNQSTNLTIKIELNSPDAALSAIALLYSL